MKHDLQLARKLLSFEGLNIPPSVARMQLEGAVAIANILEEHNVAYLADEVGMGKTYVAMGALALLRHLRPELRVAIIAPRGNIQEKWMKEMAQFSTRNLRVVDLRNKGLNGRSSRKQVKSDSLFDFVRHALIDPDRDFFLRLGSFSLSASVDENDKETVTQESQDHLFSRLRSVLPFAAKVRQGRHTKQSIKSAVARELNKVLPHFDLVIVDEGHNLKHGLKRGTAARNHVLNDVFRGKVGKVLFLSATPVEQSYGHLYGQLEVFGLEARFAKLQDRGLSKSDNVVTEEEKHECVCQFLIRRTYTIAVADQSLTRNMYRREWREGGMTTHDLPLAQPTLRQYLSTALVQKKVSDVLYKKFGNSFQMGMLASFESFGETLQKIIATNQETFYGSEQTSDKASQHGADVDVVNAMARSYRKTFHGELPHPKMDALVDHLKECFYTGEKALVFVRRIASVREIKTRMDDHYNEYILRRLLTELRVGDSSDDALATSIRDYQVSLAEAKRLKRKDSQENGTQEKDDTDRGGTDTFFAWYFRGDGPKGLFSGATLNKRFSAASGVYSTFFELNYAAYVLGVPTSKVLKHLAIALNATEAEVVDRIKTIAKYVASRGVEKPGRTRRAQFEAVQYAALEVIERECKEQSNSAQYMRQIRFDGLIIGTVENPVDIDVRRWVELPTFFSELLHDADLRQDLWGDYLSTIESHEACLTVLQRVAAISSVSRLGHSFIDLYICIANMRGTILTDHKGEHDSDDDDRETDIKVIRKWLSQLRAQRANRHAGPWLAYHEMRETTTNLDTIVDLNLFELKSASPTEYDKVASATLGKQQPTAGMYGAISNRVIRQFRMPGYPFALITTDLLQEGEDLHLFCSRIYHYGIGWMPSSMEQRTGRVDRIKSLAERRMLKMTEPITNEVKIQVYYPYLKETYETLQVKKVFERMNAFYQMMHVNKAKEWSDSSVQIDLHALTDIKMPAQYTEPIQSAFPVTKDMLTGDERDLKEDGSRAKSLAVRFASIRTELQKQNHVEWDGQTQEFRCRGVVTLESGRKEDIILSMEMEYDTVYVSCRSIIFDGRTDRLTDAWDKILSNPDLKIAILWKNVRKDAVQLRSVAEVALGDERYDTERVWWCIQRVTTAADRTEERIVKTDEDHEDPTYDD